jgi:hypothetical protein
LPVVPFRSWHSRESIAKPDGRCSRVHPLSSLRKRAKCLLQSAIPE